MSTPEKPRADACDAGPDEPLTTSSDFPAPTAATQADDAAFRTAQRLAKLEGFGLVRDGAELVLTRWNLTRVFRDVDAVLQFLHRMGRRP